MTKQNRLSHVCFAFALDIFIWSYFALVSHKIIYEKIFLALRRPEFYWSQPAMALGIGLGISLPFFFVLKSFSVGRALLRLDEEGEEHKGILQRPYAWVGMVLVAYTFVAGIIIAKVDMFEFFSHQGIQGAQRIFSALLFAFFDLFTEAGRVELLPIYELGLFAAIETIYMAFIATAFALPFAFLVSFAAARNLTRSSWISRTMYSLIRFVLNVSRSIEPLVWAIIFSVWVGIGPFSGMLALMLHSVASLAKLYSEQIEGISDGPIEAITATGAHPIQVIWFGVVPQIVLPFLSFTIYRWDINVRMATVIGLVGGGGIGTYLMQFQGQAEWKAVGVMAIIIAAIVWLMDWASSKLREAIK